MSEIKSQGKALIGELGGLRVGAWDGTRALGRRSHHIAISLG